MKIKFISFLLLCMAVHVNAQQPKSVYISGKIKNLSNKTSVFDMSAVGALRPQNSEREFIVAENGNFAVHFKISKPGYYIICHNLMYISPGDKSIVDIDSDVPENSSFRGNGADEDNYLKTSPYVHAGSYLLGGSALKKTIPESVAYVLLQAEERRKTLAALQNLPVEFVALERGRIDADIINSLELLPGLFFLVNKTPKVERPAIRKQTDSLRNSYVDKYALALASPKFLSLEVVQMNLYYILKTFQEKGVVAPEFKDWEYASEASYYINKENDRQGLQKLKVKIDSIQNRDYRAAVKELFDLKNRFADGDTAIDFQAKDINGKALSLSEFKGKIIYLDFWATWCVPCINDMPYLDGLRKKYADNPNIVFISLNTNAKIADWKQFLQKNSPQGVQLFIDPNHPHQLDPYNIVTIPRTIVIDKDFKVLSLNGPTPSNPTITKYLDGILERK